MKVALTIWENRISPVFDSAGKLLIAEIRDAEIISRRYASFNPDLTFRLAEELNDLEIEILICGAISELPANIVEAGGIKLIPFIGGNVEQVLTSYAGGRSIVPEFLMPGCGRKGGRKRGRGNAALNPNKEVRTMPKKDGTGRGGKGAGAGSGRGRGGKGAGAGSGRGGGSCGRTGGNGNKAGGGGKNAGERKDEAAGPEKEA